MARSLERSIKDNHDQKERFIEAAREAECSEDEAVFNEALKRLANAKPVKLAKRPKKGRG